MTDDGLQSIAPIDLFAVLGSAAAPVVIDVRRDPSAKGEHMLAGAACRPPQNADEWRSDLPKGASSSTAPMAASKPHFPRVPVSARRRAPSGAS